jgi:hypothetical protein
MHVERGIRHSHRLALHVHLIDSTIHPRGVAQPTTQSFAAHRWGWSRKVGRASWCCRDSASSPLTSLCLSWRAATWQHATWRHGDLAPRLRCLIRLLCPAARCRVCADGRRWAGSTTWPWPWPSTSACSLRLVPAWPLLPHTARLPDSLAPFTPIAESGHLANHASPPFR